MKYPKISIITPSFNQGNYLEHTIKSIIDQQYPNLEYIIIDGGSTDNSTDIIKKYEQHLTYWVSEKDNGMYHALQKGFERTTGEIMGWLNSDDVYHSGALFVVAQIFSDYSQIHWLQGYPTVLDTYNRIVYHRPLNLSTKYNYYLKDHLLNGEYIQQESTFWRRTLWEKAGGKINVTFKSGGAGDFELWMRFFRHEKLYTTDALIGGFRLTKFNRSITGRNQYEEETIQIINSEKLSKIDKKRIKRITFFRKYLLNIPIINSSKMIRRYYSRLFGGFPHLTFDFSQGKFQIINRKL